ncbi:hypothetical protein RHGRI_033983 [Rhododendron griersonianum]|uniref:Uncharacterized protein n=1 Tax=Rhododendron griersonianum TaxID=479676 RepID=A0AAV6HYU3_9ERIC|nr:hypothetical protein RHGRI_033983 [Rhododendron griersonianum]
MIRGGRRRGVFDSGGGYKGSILRRRRCVSRRSSKEGNKQKGFAIALSGVSCSPVLRAGQNRESDIIASRGIEGSGPMEFTFFLINNNFGISV